MPVNTQHKSYQYAQDDWLKCRDCYEGQTQIKRSTSTYLPLLSGHADITAPGYVNYLRRASFLNALRRTIQGMHGLVFRVDPVMTDNVDAGDIYQVSRWSVNEILKVGRCGILVDGDENGMARYVTYTAESIINWSSNFIVLEETVEVPSKEDRFALNCVKQYRVLTIDENGVYTNEVYSSDNKLIEKREVIVQDQKIGFIPFWVINSNNIGLDIESPPLVDLANLNISHYRNSADYEHGLHISALPTPVICGITDNDLKTMGGAIYVGTEKPIVMADTAATATFLEFSGAGLGQVKQAMDDKQSQMASLGARMLSPEKLAAETAETQMIRRQGELSSLATIANTVSEAFTEIGAFYLQWNGDNRAESFEYTLNTDFNPSGLSAEQLTAIVAAWQQRAITMADLFNLLKKGEMISSEKTLQDHQNELEEDVASTIALAPPGTDVVAA